MGRLLVTGSLAYDYILGYPGHLQTSLAPLSERDRCNITLQASQLDRHPGGCGGNICYTLALLGRHPRLLAIAGGDITPYRQDLERVGVDLSHVKVLRDELTASCIILTDSMQNRVVAFYGGATDRAPELDFEAAAGDDITACIVAPDDTAAMIAFAREARRLSLPFIFDLGSQVSSLSADEIRESVVDCQVFVCNDYEMSIFQAKTGWTLEQLQQVQKPGRQGSLIVVTQGEKGSLLYQPGKDPILVPAVPLRKAPVDSTGAGDAYRAGFCLGWMEGRPWELCARLGSTAAAFVLEAGGTQGHKFTLDEYWERYRESFGPLQ